ncbi:C1QL [Mytilus edulis]|uniref:C1QL n=1 Tax=Mytilus edulis TaxID=6550 RepID=A0A8S3TIN2_MYTED|nr:C1QL [Mytilus edulis]
MDPISLLVHLSDQRKAILYIFKWFKTAARYHEDMHAADGGGSHEGSMNAVVYLYKGYVVEYVDMGNIILIVLSVLSSTVGQETSCCSKIGQAKSTLVDAITTLQRTNRLLGETSSSISSTEVAFHARLKPYVTLGSSQIVVFDQVITNIGQAYNPNTGIFTAPNDGIYFFACTFLRPPTATQLHLQMVQNSTEISRGHAATGGGSQAGSMNAVVYMHTGDVVKVRHYPGVGSEIIHDDWSFFTGYCI